jgi:hypothetical protein
MAANQAIGVPVSCEMMFRTSPLGRPGFVVERRWHRIRCQHGDAFALAGQARDAGIAVRAQPREGAHQRTEDAVVVAARASEDLAFEPARVVTHGEHGAAQRSCLY